jgi:predicted TIM-barrel fold metal-dependent hydrolase
MPGPAQRSREDDEHAEHAEHEEGFMADNLRLADYRPKSQLRVPQHLVERPRFPVIDMHNHSQWDGTWQVTDVPALLAAMDAAGVVARVDLDGGMGARLGTHLRRFREPYPDRFAVFASVDWPPYLEHDDFGVRVAQDLRQAVRDGAEGLKLWKTLGLRLRDRSGRLIPVDDQRLAPIFDTAGELGIPVLIHTADPIAFFEPLDATNERWEELTANPDWHFYGPGFPRFDELIDQFAAMVARHPETRFIGAHMASLAEDLGRLGGLLERLPHLMVDLAARAAEIGRQPYTAAAFFARHRDRVVFGLDSWPAEADEYRVVYRLLETRDEYFPYTADPDDIPGQGRWAIYGLGLDDDILRHVYYGNALRVLPRFKATVDRALARKGE